MQVGEKTVDVVDAILGRHSVRKFRPDPVDRRVLQHILDTARFAPSMGNQQPWEVAVLTGQSLEMVKNAVAAQHEETAARQTELAFAGSPDFPKTRIPDHVFQRTRETGKRMYSALGISKSDKTDYDYILRMHRFFDAPVGLLFLLDKGLMVFSMVDLGLFLQTLMLCAFRHGLGTCTIGAVSTYPDILRKLLHIPENKYIVCGMALGYPDEQAEVNSFRTTRIPLGDFVHWYGDEGSDGL